MTRIYLPILTLLLCLAACTDDLARTDTPQPGPGEGLISLSLPGIVYDNADATSTRTQTDGGETDATRDERRVTSLWFMAYPTPNGGGEPLVQYLRPSNNELTHDYKTFNIRIKAGTYHIYVVANMSEIDPQTTEDELQKIILDYRDGTGENAPLVLPSPEGNGLPMVYESTDAVNITAAQTEPITADLVFTCVKVRCTLWFDNTTDGHSDNGHSNAVFGQNYLLMESVTGRNIATQAHLLPTEKAIEGMELLSTALNGRYADDAYSEYVHENLTFNSNSPHANGQWAYRTTFYLPEHYVTKKDDQSYLDITAALHDATGTKKANLQYTLPLGDEPTDSQPLRQLPRGKYYDIVGKIVNLGDEIESNVAIMDWTPKEVNTELESPYHLWVEKTVIPELEAGKAVTFAIRTDAPELVIGQGRFTAPDQGVTQSTEPFIITLNKNEAGEYVSVTVELNPLLPPNATIPEAYRYFSIRIPNPENGTGDEYILSKQIDIKKITFSPYLNVTPEEYVIYIRDIANLPKHEVSFTYITNLREVTVKYGETEIPANTTGSGFQIGEHITVTNSGLDPDTGMGTLTVTLDEPYEPANFPVEQTLTFDYSASYTWGINTWSDTDQSLVRIIPNAQTYRLHFRPVDDSWTNPHIYVYEPLYGMDGKEMRIQNSSGGDDGEHALQYSFTGKRTFKGWTEQGGKAVSWEAQDKDDKGNYWLLDNGWDPIYTYVYDDNIDYSPDFRTDCCASDVNPKWPGVKMKEDPENPGWYYYDLPALAEPSKALIMFAEGHDGPSGANVAQYRYPAHMVPGVPLYDYADKDGWFLYDYKKGDQNEFVDDKPNISDLPTYRINIPQNSYKRIHVWIVGGANITDWNDASTGVIQTDEKGRYFFQFSIKGSPLSGAIRYKYIDSGNSYDGEINVNDWKQVTGETYDYEYTIN